MSFLVNEMRSFVNMLMLRASWGPELEIRWAGASDIVLARSKEANVDSRKCSSLMIETTVLPVVSTQTVTNFSY